MARNWRVLHLTDFHIAQPDGVNEHLRKGYFREYIDGLSTSLKSKLNSEDKSELDAIVVTGDFVDRGQLNNFSHVQDVIQYLCQSLSVNQDRVFVCNGNHDIDRAKERDSDLAGAREDFVGFANVFGNGAPLYNNDRFTLSRCESDAYLLMIDSTIGAAGEEKPGPITTEEVDQIVGQVREQKMTSDDLLIVASHHPPVPQFNTDAPFDEETPKWHEKHIWSSAHSLYTRLRKVAVPLLWLSGDIHRPAYVIDETIHAVVTGRFGGSVHQGTSQQRRQARLVSIQHEHAHISTSWLFEYVPNGHNDLPHNGEWEAKSSPPEKHVRSSRPASGTALLADTGITAPPSREGLNSASRDVPGPAQAQTSNALQLLSQPLQTKFFQIIEEERLYSLGRFITSAAESTLAWIPMGALMDEGELLVTTINEMTKWLQTLLHREHSDEPVIVGIDSWGAILASQLSVTTGVRNYCIAGRAQGNTHSSAERISNTVTTAVAKSDMIILISDVIGTGKSLRHIYETLRDKMTEKQKQNAKWAIMSLMCDEKHARGDTLGFACAGATACKDLRIPILSNEMLPPLGVLPSDISFLRS